VTSGENEKYWTDKFAMPKEGQILLDYGLRVTINMGNAYINNGINILVDREDSIKAANAGKVIFAGEVPYDGNLIVIDHGMGIKTWYGHLGSIEVKVGDGVLKGQQIALGGRTGMATNIATSYLYFAVSIQNIFVNPVAAITDGIPGIDGANDGYGNLTDSGVELGDDSPENTGTDIPETAEETENIGGVE